jgi:hypothetical protein
MTKLDKLIYLAGFLDGDGHFYKPMTVNGRGYKHPYVRIVASQAKRHRATGRTYVLEWIKRHFGGSLYWYKGGVGRWALTGSKAVKLTTRLLPYLIVKRTQAEAVLG